MTAAPHGSANTVTLTFSDPTSTVVTVATSSSAAARRRAALEDPANIPAVEDRGLRARLAAELKRLDAFLAPRPKLKPYRAHLWTVAHHSRPPVDSRRLAALLWCTVWFPNDCR
jgi:hypothetical protein